MARLPCPLHLGVLPLKTTSHNAILRLLQNVSFSLSLCGSGMLELFPPWLLVRIALMVFVQVSFLLFLCKSFLYNLAGQSACRPHSSKMGIDWELVKNFY